MRYWGEGHVISPLANVSHLWAQIGCAAAYLPLLPAASLGAALSTIMS